MFCDELCFPQRDSPVYCDNEAAVSLVKDNGPSRGKHLDIRYHFVKDHYKWGFIDILSVDSELNPSDMGTKNQPLDLFKDHRTMIGLLDISAELKEQEKQLRQLDEP